MKIGIEIPQRISENLNNVEKLGGMPYGQLLDKIKKQLGRMTVAEKDAWILAQAKVLPDWKQEDFYKSICGTKKVINMPERNDITEFCEKVRNGDIVVEYETHYVEFDDYGHFHDDWEHDFYDPDHAMSFISSVIKGCHDLIVLEEYFFWNKIDLYCSAILLNVIPILLILFR